jgi:Protein of unknown function (DUF3179)
MISQKTIMSLLTVTSFFYVALAEENPRLLAKPGLYKPLTEPPCSYASTQHRKNLVRLDDRVIAWLRASHNGGAIPIRLFLSAPRVINDTYGLFFYDPDGDYVSAFTKDYGYEFYGWRNGVMIARSKDGTLWSALSGMAFEGPQKGKRLRRIPSMMTDWGHWLMLHPESTAYDLYDGKRYPAAALPEEMTVEARSTMGRVAPPLKPLATVLGVEAGEQTKAYPIQVEKERACILDSVSGEPLAVFWYAPTRTSVAYSTRVDGRQLTFYADKDSPETAPFKDRETGTRWTLAGRAVDGQLKGRELTWINSIQCRWYAWSSEYPNTAVYTTSK